MQTLGMSLVRTPARILTSRQGIIRAIDDFSLRANLQTPSGIIDGIHR